MFQLQEVSDRLSEQKRNYNMLNLNKVGKKALVSAKVSSVYGSSNRQQSSGYEGGSKSSAGKAFAIMTGTVVAAAGGLVGYSYVDPKFRADIENKLPFLKGFYKHTLGDSPTSLPSRREFSPASVPYSFDSGRKDDKSKIDPDKPKKTEAIVNIKIEESAATPKPLSSSKVVPVPVSTTIIKKKIVERPVDTNTVVTTEAAASVVKTKNPLQKAMKREPDAAKKNELLDESLRSAIADAEKIVKAATNAKLNTIRAVEHHIQTIREAVEAGDAADWDAVTMAHAKAERKTKEDIAAEKDGRNYIDNLYTVISIGAQDEATTLNPLLLLSRETARKLTQELDDMAAMIKKVDTERIFVRDYGKLVDEGKKRFAMEIKAILPDFEWTGETNKLKKNQLNVLLTHAHLRVDQLRRQLIEQQLREAKKIHEAVDELKAAQLHNIETKVEAKAAAGTPVPTEEQKFEIEEMKKKLDEELKQKLEEAEKKYSAQLEQVVITQKQLYDIEHAKDIENAVVTERQIHANRISNALAQLEAIEATLNSRVALDAENRRAKQLWLAVQNLVESVEYGKKGSCCMEGRRMPLERQLKILMNTAGEDHFLKAVDSSISRVTRTRGEYTKEDLLTRFDKLYRVAHRVSTLDENGGGLIKHMVAWVKDVLSVTIPINYKTHPKFDPNTETNAALLNRARYHVKRGEMLSAIKLLQLTRGPTRRLSKDLIDDVRRHEEALMLARLMLAHAAVTSIRSTY